MIEIVYLLNFLKPNIMWLTMTKNSKLILWIGQWAGDWGITNPRYYELLRRFSCVTKLRYPAVKGIRYLEHFVIPKVLPILARRYPVLFDPGAYFSRWWSGSIIVDVDDPIFTSEEIDNLKNPRISTIVTTTSELKERLSQVTGKDVKVIPSGFSAKNINVQVIQKIRHKLKASGNMVVGYTSPYLVVRQSTPPHQNDISLLLDAMELVWRKEPNIELWLIGIPDSNVRHFATTHQKVKLLGLIRRGLLLNYLCNFDVAVYPRRLDHEGRFSVKLIEYMGCGVPIVATRVTESRIVNKAQAGLVIEKNNAADFAEAILTLVKDDALREKFKSNGREFAKDYDWDRLAERYQREIFAHCTV